MDIEKENKTIKSLADVVKESFKFRSGKKGEVKSPIGHFANFIDFGEYYLVLSTDGVGTKVIVAQMVDKYDTVGIDMIAMNVNDMVCIGAEPIALVDYLAMERMDEKISREIGKGLLKGAEKSGIAIIGGETATLKDIIKGFGGNGFDLAGTCLGFMSKGKEILGDRIEVGDSLVGLSSSGIHTNGFTLARKVLFERYNIGDKLPWGRAVEEELLVPTRIYTRPVLEMIEKHFENVHGIAHISGGGLLNIKRLNDKVGFRITKPLPVPNIFKEIQKLGNVDDKEMYKTFNMGMGMCIVTDAPDDIIRMANKHGIEAGVIGHATADKKLVLEEKGIKF